MRTSGVRTDDALPLEEWIPTEVPNLPSVPWRLMDGRGSDSGFPDRPSRAELPEQGRGDLHGNQAASLVRFDPARSCKAGMCSGSLNNKLAMNPGRPGLIAAFARLLRCWVARLQPRQQLQRPTCASVLEAWHLVWRNPAPPSKLVGFPCLGRHPAQHFG